jgi:hypothetical protein
MLSITLTLRLGSHLAQRFDLFLTGVHNAGNILSGNLT